MEQGLRLNLKQSQTLTVTPQLIQTLKIVQYSAPELVEHIQHELSENPFLTELPDNHPVIDTEKDGLRDEKEYVNEYSEDSPNYSSTGSTTRLDSGSDDKSSIIEKTAAQEVDLSEMLMEQLGLVFPEDSDSFQIGEYLIGSLDEDGYLMPEVEAQCREALKVDAESFDEVLAKIRTFDPPGIASSNIQDCLIRQLERYEDYDTSLEREIVAKHFEELRKKKYADLAKVLDATEEEVDRAAHLIATLEPKPARRYRNVENAVIIPDVTVRRVNDEFQILVNDEVIPRIAFNDEYKKLLKVKDNPELKKYLQEREEKALNLINSIRYRKTNLIKVMRKLIEIQKQFFLEGPKGLVPYTLVKLSEEIGVNQGTLSRIANSKYVNTEWGAFSLKIFFSSSVQSTTGEVSSNKIKLAIEEIIQSFGPDTKLSDQKIAEVLAKRGFRVARRTVAKYRNSLKILSSFHR